MNIDKIGGEEASSFIARGMVGSLLLPFCGERRCRSNSFTWAAFIAPTPLGTKGETEGRKDE